jgi:hypothetical protein
MNMLADLIHAKRIHAAPLNAVEDLPWELAGRKVAHLPHTIWQQVGHLNYWMDYALKNIEGNRPPWPAHAAETWPQADGPADGMTWRHEVALFRTNLDQLSTLANARASTLSRIVHPKSGTTVEAILWQTVVHNSYHVGQIVQLRQALGSWPPTGGGETW